MLSLYGINGAILEALLQGHLLLSRTIITTTLASTYTTPANCNLLFVECIGGGGAGPSTGNSTAGNIIVGSGGVGGCYAAQIVPTVPGKLFAVNVGTGASGTASSFKSNDTNSPTTFVSAPSGANGTTLANGNTELFAGPGTGVAGAAAGSPAIPISSEGQTCHRVSGTVASAGRGGNGPYGGSAQARITHGNGSAGGNYGGGGSGGMSVNAGGTTTAGAGGQGVVIVWEFT